MSQSKQAACKPEIDPPAPVLIALCPVCYAYSPFDGWELVCVAPWCGAVTPGEELVNGEVLDVDEWRDVQKWWWDYV